MPAPVQIKWYLEYFFLWRISYSFELAGDATVTQPERCGQMAHSGTGTDGAGIFDFSLPGLGCGSFLWWGKSQKQTG
jgi:hypothetical protein